MSVEIVGIQTETTFAITLSETAVRALAMIGEFGGDALTKAVATKLSEAEAKRHAKGLTELVQIGTEATMYLRRLKDARDVASGYKIAADLPKPATSVV